MPRKGGKKKKGKVVRADRDAVQTVGGALQQKISQMATKEGVVGLQLPKDRTASNMDESQYTYYSESVNQSAMVDNDGPSTNAAAQEADLRNIKADIEEAERCQENTKERDEDESAVSGGEQKQILTARPRQESNNQIQFEDGDDRAASKTTRESNKPGGAETTSAAAAPDSTYGDATYPSAVSQQADGGSQEGSKKSAQCQITTQQVDQEQAATEIVQHAQPAEEVKESATEKQSSTTKQVLATKSEPVTPAAPAEAQEPAAAEDTDAQKVEKEEKGAKADFFDDFDAAFNSDDDFSLPMKPKKEAKPAEEPTEAPTEKKEEEPAQSETPAEQDNKEEGEKGKKEDFFDDFDAAFGSDNDVDILVLPKKKEEPKQPAASEAQPEEPEAPKEVQNQPEPAKASEKPKVSFVDEQNTTQSATVTSQVSEEKPALKASAGLMLGPQIGAEEATISRSMEPAQVVVPEPASEPAPQQAATSVPQPAPAQEPEKEFRWNFTLIPTEAEETPQGSQKDEPEPIQKEPEPIQEEPEPVKEEQEAKQTVMIDTSDSKGRPSAKDDDEGAVSTQQDAAAQDETVKSDDEEETAGGGGKVLLFGLFCAAAAGAAMYVKKNNIPVEEIIRTKLQTLYNQFVAK